VNLYSTYSKVRYL